ncbi:flagellar hook-associated protein FlgK [Thalassospira sp.]|uniref:flagellar hook-associated protein FlgK n=1 Tax=Thalassospira sp. TaxID=1912094 RepID=UPI000C3FB324|nr:flagellar hook-associated protein FlgK [Thalassospira sp.]MBC07799.1 flagellar hook-associated protein FlgK [Thalassospira sp.]|tara:strand:+ start:4544 stop:6955 length:2412 start_codon:yes stop_codon:yes gene_type:complete
MSLTQALNTAISGLNTAQARIAITSSNISNVNTEGYSKKIAGQETLTLDGIGAGSQVADIYRNVNEGLVREMRGELGKAGREEARYEFFMRIQTLFGTTQSDAAISQRINDMADAFEQLGVTPDQNSPRIEAIESAIQVMESFEKLSSQLQDLRDDIDDQITDEVNTANTLLTQISELNTGIIRLKNLEQPTTELQDQRDQKLNQLSKIIDITTFSRSDGSIVVYSANGSNTLLDRSPNSLSFTQTAGFEPGTGGSGITLDGEDITDTLRTGTLKGLFEMRDSEIPALNDQINELAGELRDAINQEHNKGTSFPPPANLSGTRTVAGSDPLTATGAFRVAALDIDGNLVATDSWADISLPTTPATVQGIVDAINASDASSYLTASLVDNRLVIEGQDGNRVAINEMDSEITLSDGRKQGASHYFGLNDFIATTKRSDTMTSAPQSSSTDALGVTASSFTITAGTGVLAGAGITVNYAATDSLEDVRDSIRTALQGAGMTVAASEEAAFLVEDGDRFRLVVEYNANLTITDSGTMSTKIGFTEDRPNLSGNMDVAASIKNDPSRIVRGQLNADTYNTSTAVVNPDTAIPNLGPLVPPPTNYTLTVSGDFTDVDIDYDSTTSLQDIADAINNSATLTDNNITAEVKFDSQLGGYKLHVIDADGDPFYFSDDGLPNTDAITTVLGLGINFGVHEGDNSAANAISNAFERTDIDFEATDGLSGERTSLTDYAAGIVATAATKARVAESSFDFQDNLVIDLSTRIQNEAGVNLDEEMSDLVIFQRAYTATAQVISTVDEMFDALLNAV